MLLLLASLALAAETVKIDIEFPQEAIDAGLDPEQLEAELEGVIEENLRTVDLEGYAKQMADANALSGRGMGVDYGSDMQRFAFGGAFGTAVNGAGAALDGGTEEGLPESGFALQIGVMAGLNLGAFSEKDSPLRRFKVYVNGMSAKTDRGAFSGTFLNYGAHLQTKIVKGGDKTDGIRWGGLDLTAGYEHAGYSLSLEQELPIGTDELMWNATGTYVLSASSDSIPLELSTNLHVFVVTVFLGAGFDYNLAVSAASEARVTGPVDLSYGGRTESVGSAAVTIGTSSDGSQYVPRAFVGAQADILFVKVYGQLNVTLDQSVGGHVGLRFVL